METTGHERDEAEDVEVDRLIGASATEIDEEANAEVESSGAVVIVGRGVARRVLDEDLVDVELDAVAAQGVAGVAEALHGPEGLGDVEGTVDGEVADANELVALADAGLGAGTAGGNVAGHNGGFSVGLGAVEPGDAVVLDRVRPQVQEAEYGRNSGGDCQN